MYHLVWGQQESELAGVPQLVRHGVLGADDAERRVHRPARRHAELRGHADHRVRSPVHRVRRLRALQELFFWYDCTFNISVVQRWGPSINNVT